MRDRPINLIGWVQLLLVLAALAIVASRALPAEPPADARTVVPAVQYSVQHTLDVALADAEAIHKAGGDPSQYRWAGSPNQTTEEGLAAMERQVAFTTNQLNFFGRLPAVPVRVDKAGRVLRIDLKALHLKPEVYDRLLAKGSGKGAYPEPYYHFLQTVLDKKVEVRTRKIKRVWPGGPDKTGREFPKGYEYEVEEEFEHVAAEKQSEQLVQAPWLDQGKALRLALLVRSEFALVRSDWLVNYALRPPFYLDAQGNPKNLDDVHKLAGLVKSGKRGTRLFGAVLFSEVANANRRTERVPLETNYGRGAFHQTYDFFSSIRRQNVLRDVLIEEGADAGEFFWTLPNGLYGWGLNDGANKIIDVADARIAINNRTFVHSKAVEQGWSCITCHPRGPLLVADEVRLTGQDIIALADTKVKDKARQERIADVYFGEEYNRLLIADQENYDAAVRGLTDKAAAAVSLEYEHAVWRYLDRPIGPEDVAVETGYPLDVVLQVIDAGSKVGLDQVFVRMLKARKARRDQFEEAFGNIMVYLARVPEKGGKP